MLTRETPYYLDSSLIVAPAWPLYPGHPYLLAWDHAWKKRRGKRASDTALAYADGGCRGYLLLTILWEPMG
jgi:hypothetical protein